MMALSTDESPHIPAQAGQKTEPASAPQPRGKPAPGRQSGRSSAYRALPLASGLLLGAMLAFALQEIWPNFFRQSAQAVAGLPPGLLLLLLLPAGGFLTLLVLRSRSRGRAAIAALQQRLAEESRDKEKLAQILANFPDPVVLCDSQGRIAAASKAALRGDAESLEALRGRGLSVLYGEDSARTLKKINDEVLATGQAKSSLFRISRRGETRYCRREHRRLSLPVPNKTAPDKAAEAESILLVERDVTTEIQEGDRRRRGQRAFIELLLDVVDQNDPLAAQTGRRIGDLAARLAEDIELSGSERRTAQNAGYLLALVDARVPRAVLRGDLPGRPVDYVCLAREEVADLVGQLELDGDLAECLRQLDERMDGRGGPRGLKSPQILPAARVLKVADGYLRRLMIQGEGLAAQDRALSEMLKEADQAYDGDCVDSLVCLISRDLEAGMVDGFDDIAGDQSH